MRDLVTHISGVAALAAVAAAKADFVGLPIDLRGANAVAVFLSVPATGDVLSGANNFKIGFDEADEDPANPGQPGAFTPVPDVKVIGDRTVNGVGVFKTGCLSIKRFVRLNVDAQGAHPNGTDFSALAVKGHLQAEGKGW